MTHQEIRDKFIKFFEARGHKVVPSASLMPTDPSVLFTTAGMQQFKYYYTGQSDAMKDFGSLNTASIQKCVRTSDIDEVGDESHLTFFEMLGNFSFGGYFKKEAIKYGYDFIVKEMGLKIDYVSIFEGDVDVPADEDSEKFWKEVDPDIVIKKFGRKDNFWGPTGAEGPCGPTTEIYVNGLEIWNIVFNQYYQHADKKLELLKTPGIDTGMGLERLAMVGQGVSNIFETDLLKPMMDILPSNLPIRQKRIAVDHVRAFAFLKEDGFVESSKDDMGGSVLNKLQRDTFDFGISKDIISKIAIKIYNIYGPIYPELSPSSGSYNRVTNLTGPSDPDSATNIGQSGYSGATGSSLMRGYDGFQIIKSKLRGDRMFTRKISNITTSTIAGIETADNILNKSVSEYNSLHNKDIANAVKALNIIEGIIEKNKIKGLKAQMHIPGQKIVIREMPLEDLINSTRLSGDEAFDIYQRTGARIEQIKDIAESYDLEVDLDGFEEAKRKHQELSRAGAEKKFGGHGIAKGDLTAANDEELGIKTKYHTATHLLQAALRKILGDSIKQSGSDINAERLRFDFTLDRKMTTEEIKQVEDLINRAIKQDLIVNSEEMSFDEAIKSGALAFFKLKYPEKITVYTIGNKNNYFSREVCGGPHVQHTGEIGGIKIAKEEAVSAGIRRIRIQLTN